MKLIVQIPCYKEEDTLAIALKEVPRSIPGIDTVELLIINDGRISDHAGCLFVGFAGDKPQIIRRYSIQTTER